MLNKRFKYEYVNENAFQHTLGYSSKDILGKSALKFIHPDDLSQIAKTLFEGFKRGKGEAELRFRHKEGHWVWIESKGQTFFDKNGEIKAIVISRDITQRKLSEQKLKDSEEKYRLISENANDLIRVFNEKFEIEYINESTHKKLLGYSKKDLVGKFGRNIVHPDEYEELKTHLRNVFKTGEGVREGRLKHKNGSWRWFEVKSKMFIDDDGNRKLLSISRDITQRKEAEEKLKRSYEETKFYKDLFMHDIANIYGTVELSTELLDMYKSDLVKNEKEIFDTIKILKSQTNRGSKLISNIQKLSYLEDEKLNLEEIDVNNMLEKAIEFVKKGFLLKKVNITTDTLSGNIYVLANDLLIDVFENILINSIKFTDANIAEVIVRSLMEGDYLKIEFIDKGIGVKDELKKKIFEKGFKTKSKGAGMGLGLYLVKKLVEYYKGKIWVEDRVKGDYSKGSKFIILLKSIKGTQKY